MKLAVALLVAVLVMPDVGAPGPAKVASVASFGDTLRYTLTCDTATHATSYTWRVTASKTNAVWNGLPNNTITTPCAITYNALGGPVPPWDSATFTAVVRARNLVSTSPDSSLVVWSIRRAHVGNPGPIAVDSSQAQY